MGERRRQGGEGKKTGAERRGKIFVNGKWRIE